MKKIIYLSVLFIVFFGALFFPNNSYASFIQEQKLTASDGVTGDGLGASMTISADGTRMVAGAPGANSNTGAVYIYLRSGTTWTEEQKLTASDGVAGDTFGLATSMSADGTRIAVGAYGVATNTGAVYVYSRTGSTWTFEQKLTASDGVSGDYFGVPVSISNDGTRIVASANSANSSRGAAYVFSRFGTVWTEEQKLTASDGVAGDTFGSSSVISTDGANIIIGAVGVSAGRGAAYVFSRSGTTWTEEQKLTASDGVSLDGFGISLSISSDGTRLAVGAYGWGPSGSSNNQGAVYVFSHGLTWTEEQKLTASDGVAGDFFGYASVAMNEDSTRLAIAAAGVNTFTGAAYVFSRSGTTWTEEQKLIPTDGAASDFFGNSMSITTDGIRFAVGASGNSGKGAVYVFNFPSNIATVSSGNYIISTAGGGAETITNVPFGTSEAAFLAALTKDNVNETWNISSLSDPVVTGNTLVATAEDGVTQVIYTLTTSPEPMHVGISSSSGGHIGFVPTSIVPPVPPPSASCSAGEKFSTVTGLPCASFTEPSLPPTTPGPTFPTPKCLVNVTLRQDSSGEQVKCLQAILKLPSDGFFGPRTKVAVIEFQKLHKLMADGIVGAKTRMALFK